MLLFSFFLRLFHCCFVSQFSPTNSEPAITVFRVTFRIVSRRPRMFVHFFDKLSSSIIPLCASGPVCPSHATRFLGRQPYSNCIFCLSGVLSIYSVWSPATPDLSPLLTRLRRVDPAPSPSLIRASQLCGANITIITA